MICIHHNKDLDGFSSGAIVKLKYPEAKLIGWDYRDDLPDFEQFRGQDVIMIDISFPLQKMVELGLICNLTVIDHHISLKREFDAQEKGFETFTYIYEADKAACEIGWKYLFPDEQIPYTITLLGRYDTWRQQEGDWDGETLPFQYAMRLECISAETFPTFLLENSEEFQGDSLVSEYTNIGKMVLKYQEQQDLISCERSSFEKEVFGGLKGLCLNSRAFSSNTMKSVYDESKHDIMIGFEYARNKWTVSLRSVGNKVDCSVIAKARGGGGHKNAAGFETDSFEKIFI